MTSGKLIEPISKTVQAFKVSGLTVRTQNSDEMQPETAKLKKLWECFFAEHWLEKIQHKLTGNHFVYGVYSNYASDHNDFYTVTAGVAVSEASSQEKEIQTILIESGNYLVFENQGEMPKVVIEAWQAVWHYFQGHSDSALKRKYATDFEVYLDKDKVALYIGIE